VVREIRSSRAVVLVLSSSSLDSRQVGKEINWVDEQGKPLIPLLHGISQEDIRSRHEEHAATLGRVVSMPIPEEGLTDRFLDRLLRGLRNLGLEPQETRVTRPDPLEERLVEAHRLLRDRSTLAQAEQALQSILTEHPDSPHAHRYLGQLYNRSFRPGDAVEAFEQAVALEPGSALLHWELGLAYQAQGRVRDAATTLRRAVDLGLDPEREKRARTLADRLGPVGR
jgi:tetratricopeptide (TPR) repeat protein